MIIYQVFRPTQLIGHRLQQSDDVRRRRSFITAKKWVFNLNFLRNQMSRFNLFKILQTTILGTFKYSVPELLGKLNMIQGFISILQVKSRN